MNIANRICINCGTTFIFKLSQLNAYRGGGKFCSRKCHYDFYKNNPDLHPLFKDNKKD